MKKIELTDDEIKVIKKQLKEECIFETATEEEQRLLMGVIHKAEDLMDELNAYDEVGDDLIAWFYNKYQAQCSES